MSEEEKQGSLRNKVEILEKNQKRLAEGMKRAEKIIEDWDGEILMEKCTIQGVEFSGE